MAIEAEAQTNFEPTRPIFEEAVQQAPANAMRHANLGLLYSFMGRKEEAIREGRRAVELMPDSKDAVNGPWMTGFLAMIYARVGEADSALPLLEHLLASPGPVDNTNCCITHNDLRHRWQWDPLPQRSAFSEARSPSRAPKTGFQVGAWSRRCRCSRSALGRSSSGRQLRRREQMLAGRRLSADAGSGGAAATSAIRRRLHGPALTRRTLADRAMT